jgi:hypothetical protein
MREHLLPRVIEATASLVENDLEDLSPTVERQLHQLRDAIFSLRGNLPEPCVSKKRWRSPMGNSSRLA